MLINLNPTVHPNPVCTRETLDLKYFDFFYYDKDGFELNIAEKSFYRAMGFPVLSCLNHECWQLDWLKVNESNLIIIDHCLVLQRASYGDQALEQLKKLVKYIPFASYLINTKQKWGFDIALDAVDEHNQPFEVIHIEYDELSYDPFMQKLSKITQMLYNIDWINAAKRVNDMKEHWIGLKGFEQNNWKANFLLGWNKAEYTDKAI